MINDISLDKNYTIGNSYLFSGFKHEDFINGERKIIGILPKQEYCKSCTSKACKGPLRLDLTISMNVEGEFLEIPRTGQICGYDKNDREKPLFR